LLNQLPIALEGKALVKGAPISQVSMFSVLTYDCLLIVLGRLYRSERKTKEFDQREADEEDAIMATEYKRLVASGGEAEPLWVEKFSSALCEAGAFWSQQIRRPSAKALSNLKDV
jgi:hypothetical protein